MDTNDILARVLLLMKNKMYVPEELLTEKNYTVPLTGNGFQFSAVELGHLFYLIEKEFHCRIDTSLICRYEFNTLAGIAEVLKKSEAQ